MLFEENAVTEPQNFPGQTPVQNLAPYDGDLAGGQILFDLLSDMASASLLNSMIADSRNAVLTAPVVHAHSGQTVMHMVDDIEPTLQQIVADFRMNIQAVTPSPFKKAW